MAAKFDAQMVKKHLFWILLGVAALFELVLMLMLPFMDPGAKDRKDYEDTFKTSKGLTSGFKNKDFLPAWEARKTEYEGEKNRTWAKAWEPQGGDSLKTIYYSPPGMKQLVYPTDDIAGAQRTDYKNKYYSSQFPVFETELKFPIYKDFDKKPDAWRVLQGPTPIDFGAGSGGQGGSDGGDGGPKGKGGMGAMGAMPGMGGMGKGASGAGAAPGAKGPGLRALLEERGTFKLDPTREEIWILQEDLSVRREVVRLFREALAEIGAMRPVPASSGDPKNAIVLANPYWKVKLVPAGLGRIDQASSLENVHAQHRPMALYDKTAGWSTRFAIVQPGAGNSQPLYQEIKLEGDPVMYQQARSFKDFQQFNIGTIDLTKPFAMVQLFDPGNSPIQRIEKVALGGMGQSHRTMEFELKARSTLPAEKPEESADAAAGGGGGGAGMMMGGMGGMASPGAEGMGGMGGMGGGGAAKGDLTNNNQVDRARYIVANELCRHLPLGIRVVVDQAEVPTVLTAVANSRMRMQITQVDWAHQPGGPGGQMAGGPGSGMAGGPGGAQPGGPGGGMGARPGGFPGAPGGGNTLPGGGPGGNSEGGSGGAASPAVQTSQMVDLAVYAIASLYERYPPKPASDVAAAEPAK